jgi:hypothetical protein
LAVLGSYRCGALAYCRNIFICSYNNSKYRSMIRKMPNKNVWKLYSKKGDVLGTFRSKKKAEERERQINYFKSRNK